MTKQKKQLFYILVKHEHTRCPSNCLKEFGKVWQSLAKFGKVWQRGDYWILTLLELGQNYSYLDPFIFTRAALDMLTVGLKQKALDYLITAAKVWPKKWLSYFLLGNHYLNQSNEAASWFSKGYKYASENPEYLNNYAYALVQEGCITAAKKLITAALRISPKDKNLLATKNEFASIPTPIEASIQNNCASYNL